MLQSNLQTSSAVMGGRALPDSQPSRPARLSRVGQFFRSNQRSFLAMRNITCVATSLAAVLSLFPPPALAQLTVSYVSSTGSNNNPCTRASPCATFAKAVTVTDTQGTVNCLDSGPFDFDSSAIQITQ